MYLVKCFSLWLVGFGRQNFVEKFKNFIESNLSTTIYKNVVLWSQHYCFDMDLSPSNGGVKGNGSMPVFCLYLGMIMSTAIFIIDWIDSKFLQSKQYVFFHVLAHVCQFR